MENKFLEKLALYHSRSWKATPDKKEAILWLNELIGFLFPADHLSNVEMYPATLEKSQKELEKILNSYLDQANSLRVSDLISGFYSSLETLFDNLLQDANLIYENDPAATTVQEVIVSYPGFFAIIVYRISHILFQLQIPILPRLLSEYAHSSTGVDIHPQAEIGVPFFIDHGTGVVIGATSIIGKKVSIYQGVTLGALQVSKKLSGTKRHPTVEDNVIIYAGTTILGGNTVIGQGSIIGGNVFLTKSIPAGSKVFNTHQMRISQASASF